jgi:hypothetical protein
MEKTSNSGTMRLVSDKDLLMSIWKAYNSCTELNEVLDLYCNRKMEHIEREAILNKNGELNFKELNYVKAAPMYNFYAVSFATVALDYKEKGLKPVKETLSTLEGRK